VTGTGLITSMDEGATWTEVKVSGLDVSTVQAIGFAGQSGWIVSLTADGTALQSIETHNGGAEWSTTILPGSFPDGVNSVAVDALDNSTVFITIKMPFSPAESIGYALESGDGGKTWSSVDLPNGDPVAFRTVLDGWQAGGPVNQELNRSQDGGKMWNPVKLPIPAEHKDDRVAYSNPVFFGEDGVLAVYLRGQEGGPLVVAFFASQNRGDDWVLSSSIDASSDGAQVPVVITGPTSWLVETSNGLQASSDGVAFSSVGESGLAPSSVALLGSSEHVLWAVVAESSCNAYKSDCRTKTLLERSTDGGLTWAAIGS